MTEKFCLNFALFPFDIFGQAVCSSFAIYSFGRFILACLFGNDLVMNKYCSESYESNWIFQRVGWKVVGWELVNR